MAQLVSQKHKAKYRVAQHVGESRSAAVETILQEHHRRRRALPRGARRSIESDRKIASDRIFHVAQADSVVESDRNVLFQVKAKSVEAQLACAVLNEGLFHSQWWPQPSSEENTLHSSSQDKFYSQHRTILKLSVLSVQFHRRGRVARVLARVDFISFVSGANHFRLGIK